MEFIIGRESVQNGSLGRRLKIQGANKKEFFFGAEGSVPLSVSRQHCKLIIGDDGSCTLVNLKLENVTYVNGLETMQKRVTGNDRIQLGPEKYEVLLSDILSALDSELPKYKSIRHLEAVWDKYQADVRKMKLDRQKSQAKQQTTGAFTMGAMLIGFIPAIPSEVRMALYAIAFVLTIYFCIERFAKPKKNIQEEEDMENRFRKQYICPNKDCGRFLGKTPYEDIVKFQKCCPYCKTNYKA